MSSRLYELKARIKADASVALEVRDLYTVNGKEFEGDPRPIADGDADTVAFLAGFNSAAVAERDAKISELAQAQTDHQAALAAKDAAHADEVATLNADHAAAVQAKDDEIAALNESLAAATAAKQTAEAALTTAETALTAAQARIAELEAELDALKNPPVDPRVLYPSEFQARLTRSERKAIFRAAGSENEILSDIGLEAISTMWTVTRVELDNALLIELLGALEQAGLIAPGRAAELRA